MAVVADERAQRLADIERCRALARQWNGRAAKYEADYWRWVRETVTPCEPRQHDVEKIVGNVFTIYRCRRCGDEEWL